MTTRNLILSLCFAVFAASLCADDLDPKSWEKLSAAYQRAGGYYRQKQYDKAIEGYGEALKLVPKGEEHDGLRQRVHQSLAQNYALLGKHKECLENLNRAVDNGLGDLRDIVRNDDFDAVRKLDGYLEVEKRAAVKLEELRAKARDAQKSKLAGLKNFDFDLTAIDGKKIAKKDYAGKVLIVDIWGTWCGPCLQEVPHFVALQKKYEKDGLAIVGLNSERAPTERENAAKVRAMVTKMGINYPCALIANPFLKQVPNFQGFPTTLFFGRDGTPRAMEVGARGFEELEALVKPLLAEKIEAPAEKKAPEAKAAEPASPPTKS